MDEKQAIKIFYDYIKREYSSIEILSIKEKKAYFLFEFSQKGDDCPIDYPVIAVKKDNGKVRELMFTNADDREIIYGD